MKRGPCPIGDTPHNGTWREKIQDYRCMRHAQGLRHPIKKRGGSRFPKRRDYDYQAWIRQKPCIICGTSPVDVAHVKTKGSGGDDMDNVVPLCSGPSGHHAEQHSIGILTFQKKHRIVLSATAKRFGRRWRKENSTLPTKT